MKWLYKFTANDRVPGPLDEIHALVKIATSGDTPWLMLTDRQDAPGKRASSGHTFLLCVPDDRQKLLVHAVASVDGRAQLLANAPDPVAELYGASGRRWYLPLRTVNLCSTPEPVKALTAAQIKTFLSGQAYVRRLP